MSIISIDETKENSKVIVVVCLDQTSSMYKVKKETINGFNEYMDTLEKNPDISVTLIKFNSEIGIQTTPNYNKTRLDDSTYQPDGMTPLLDAVGHAIREAEKQDTGTNKILLTIQTDGEENSSKEYTFDSIKKLISEKQSKPNWTITFLGAGIDAWNSFGNNIGLFSGNVLSYYPESTMQTFSDLGQQTVTYAANTSKSATRNFFDSNTGD
jgi:hypothetical protein